MVLLSNPFAQNSDPKEKPSTNEGHEKKGTFLEAF